MEDNNGFDTRMNQAKANNSANSAIKNVQQKGNLQKDSDVQKRNSGLDSKRANSNSSLTPSKSSNNISNTHNSSSNNSVSSAQNMSPKAPFNKRTTGKNLVNDEGLHNNASSNQSSTMGNPSYIQRMMSGLRKNNDKSTPGLTTAGRIVNALNKGKNMAKKGIFSFNQSSAKVDDSTGKEEVKEKVEDNPAKEMENVAVTLPKKVVKVALIVASVFPLIIIIILAVVLSMNGIQKLVVKKIINDTLHSDTKQEDIFGEDSNEDYDEDIDKSLDDAFIIRKDFNIYLKDNQKYIDDNTKSNTKFTAKSSMDIDLTPLKTYYKIDCNGKECEKEDTYRFYRKLYDIYYLYKYKYNVKINVSMIAATLDYNSITEEETFRQNLNDYDTKAVRENDYDNDNITNLDWEFDYKKYDGYTYLNAKDFRYDMQILAKNMVTKKITYKCGSKSKEAKDIENSNYSSQLKCDNGDLDESSISATYELDMEKYDEFLLEYLEHKYYLVGSEVKETDENTTTSTASNSMAQAMVKVAEEEVKKFHKGETTAATYQSYTGVPDAWCASFVSYVIGHTEYKGKKMSDIVPVKSAAVNSFADYFTSKGKFYHNSNCSHYSSYKKYNPKMGDIVIFHNNGLSCPSLEHSCLDHIGIVEKIENGKVFTLEGNTGVGVADQNSFELNSCQIIAYGSWY